MARNDKYNRELFTKISEKSNYIDEEVVERVYMGILKVLATELKEGNDVFLPHWGKFWLTQGMDNYKKTPVWVVKFRPNLKFKKFMQNKRENVNIEDNREDGIED